MVLRRVGRIPAHDRRPGRPGIQASRDHAAYRRVHVRARVVPGRQTALVRRQSPYALVAGRCHRQGDEDRLGHVPRSAAPDRGGVVAGLALARVLQEPRQSHAGGVPLLVCRWQEPSGDRWNVGRDFTRIRRRRQVPVFPGEHGHRTGHWMARDELARPPGAPLHLYDRAERDRALAAPPGNGRRAGAAEHTSAKCSKAKRERGQRKCGKRTSGNGETRQRSSGRSHRRGWNWAAHSRTEHPAGELQQPDGRRGGVVLLSGAGCGRRTRTRVAAPAAIPAQGSIGRALSRGCALIHALRRQEEAALSGRWSRTGGECVGNRSRRPAGEGGRRCDQRGAARDAGGSARRVAADIP